MVAFTKIQLTLALAAIFLFSNAMSKFCECPDDTYCCNRRGYCGTTEDYCGWPDCIDGPCDTPPAPNDFAIQDAVSDEFWDSLFNYSMPNCTGHTFYTRQAFLKAAQNQPLFARIGNETDSYLTLAAFFAIALDPKLTYDFCYVQTPNEEEQNEEYCDAILNVTYPCVAGEKYYGRGPLQLKWNYYYGQAGQAMGFNFLEYPDLVHEDPVLSFEASMWFWVNIVHEKFISSFGHATRAVDIGLCDGGDDVDDEIAIASFKKFCNLFGVDYNLKNPLHC